MRNNVVFSVPIFFTVLSSFLLPFPGGVLRITKLKCLITARCSCWVNSYWGRSNKQNIFSFLQDFSHQLLKGFSPALLNFLSTLVKL